MSYLQVGADGSNSMTRLCLEGDEATWKTGLALTAPGKKILFSFDPGFKRAFYGVKYPEYFQGKTVRVISKEELMGVVGDPALPGLKTSADLRASWANTEVTVFDLPEPIQISVGGGVAGASELFAKFSIVISECFADPMVDTIILDTATIARRIAADSHLQSVQKTNPGRIQLIQIEYGKPNDLIRAIYGTAEASDKNFIAIHHLTDDYEEYIDAKGEVKSRKTGKRVMEGLANTYRWFDVCFRMTKEQTTHYQTHQPMTVIKATYVKCGYDLSKEGTFLINPTWNTMAQDLNKGIYDPSAQIPESVLSSAQQ